MIDPGGLVRIPTIALMVLAFALSACAAKQFRKQQVVSEGVVLPNKMCASYGKVALSNDVEGERMICEMEEPVGSHLPKCVCRDELALADEKDKTQETMRALQEHHQTGMGGQGGK
jgi:hypothetical protein